MRACPQRGCSLLCLRQDGRRNVYANVLSVACPAWGVRGDGMPDTAQCGDDEHASMVPHLPNPHPNPHPHPHPNPNRNPKVGVGTVVAERLLYTPSVGFCVLLTLTLALTLTLTLTLNPKP